MSVESTFAKDSPFNFERFAQQPEYQQVNRELIRIAISNLHQKFINIVDVACGTGLVPKLLIEESQRTGQRGRIIGIDPNPTSLEIARKTTLGSKDVSVEFIEGFGQDIRTLLKDKIPEDGVDGVSILDAIHEIPGEEDKKQVLSSMVAILKPGGVLLLNSAFTTVAMEGSAMDWGKWKMTALKWLNGTRDKNVISIKIHTPEEYREMLENTGLVIIHEAKKPINLTKSALKAISKYPEFIEGVFRDMKETASVGLEKKSQALISALDQLNIAGIKRTWHEIIAQKPPTTTSLA